MRKLCERTNHGTGPLSCIIAGDKDLKIWTSAEYEKENIGTAFAALKVLSIPEKKIISGLEKSYWPGRFEFVAPDILVDCAGKRLDLRKLDDAVVCSGVTVPEKERRPEGIMVCGNNEIISQGLKPPYFVSERQGDASGIPRACALIPHSNVSLVSKANEF